LILIIYNQFILYTYYAMIDAFCGIKD